MPPGQVPVAGGLILLHAADPAPWSAEGFAAALASLPAFMHDEIMALRRWQDRQARVLARLLLRTGLARLGLAREASLRDWTRDPAGRPRLPGCPADFSLSHTSGLAVCALSLEGRVGVDVERLALTDLAELRLAFGPGEWAAIQAAPDPSLALLRLWTAKEAALKADGRGLSIEPAEIDGRGQVVAVRQAFWHISTPDLAPGWVCALASATRAPALDIVEARAADLAPPG